MDFDKCLCRVGLARLSGGGGEMAEHCRCYCCQPRQDHSTLALRGEMLPVGLDEGTGLVVCKKMVISVQECHLGWGFFCIQ